MTKHLRLIMLSLLAMICLGGYSQSKGPEVTLDFSDYKGNPWDISTSSYCKETKTYTNGTYSIILTPGEAKGFMLSNYKGTGYLQMGKKNASITLPAFNFDVEKIVVVAPPSGMGNKSVTQNVYVDKVAVSTQTTGCQSNKEYQINEEYQKSGNRYVIKVTNGYLTFMSKIQIYKKQGSGKTATTLSFKDLVGEAVTLINGKLANGNDFKGYTATEKDNVAGTIAYAASGAGVATVDKKTGAVTVYPNVFGTTTITATFRPTDTEKYAESTASYTVINERTPTTITFGSEVDNNTFEVKDGEIVETRVATVTPVEATGSIEYNSSDEAIAKVDVATGAITLGAKYGTALITAKFVATGSFAKSEASYSIKHVGDFLFYESFDKCEGTGGNDDNFFGNIASGAWKAEKLDEVWTKSGKVFLGNKCIRIGKDASSVTTSSIEYTGKSILTFKAAAWSTEDTKVKLTITGGTLKYGESEPTTSVSFNPTKGEWQTFEMEVTSTGPFTLQFANETTSYRFFLDEVMIKKVKEAASKEITLDENSDNIVAAAENVNVTLKRTLYGDGGWNTLCVPFSLTAAQVKAAFGNDVELRELESVAGNTLTFKTVNSVTADVPCLIKVTANGSEYKFEGVSTTAVKDNRYYTFSDVKGDIMFLGIYSAMDVVEADLAGLSTTGYYAFLGANNTFFKAKTGPKMKGFRAFFSVPNDVNNEKLKAVIDGTTTGIEDLVVDGVKANGRVYNLNGQYVGNSLYGLQPGLYIQNGKKIVVK